MKNKDALKDAVLKSWEIILEGLAKEKRSLRKEKNEWRIESRSKLKSLSLALGEREDPSDAVLHLIKYAEYMLPRSSLTATLSKFLSVMKELREEYGNDPKKLREVVAYMIGYMMWSLDSICNILTIAGDDEGRVRAELKTMIGLEISLVGEGSDYGEKLVNGLIEWRKMANQMPRNQDAKGGD